MAAAPLRALRAPDSAAPGVPQLEARAVEALLSGDLPLQRHDSEAFQNSKKGGS